MRAERVEGRVRRLPWLAVVLVLAGSAAAAPDVETLLAQLVGAEPTEVAPFCVRDEAEPHVLLVYARPFDAPDTLEETAPRLRTAIREANAIVRNEAERIGWRYDLRVLCDDAGAPVVRGAVLPTPGAEDDYASIKRDLLAAGVAAPDAKMLVAYEGAVGSLGGEGDVLPDDRAGPENLNDRGGSVAVVYGTQARAGWLYLHELLHTLGAVQDSSPHATGAGHCNDGSDVMCKRDEGPNSDYETVCGSRRLDCGSDDYFDPEPPEGSHLATHWNVATSRYFERAPLPDEPFFGLLP